MAQMLFGDLGIKQKDEKSRLLTFNLDRDITADGAVPEAYYREGAGVVSIPYDFAALPQDELQLIQNYRELAASSVVDEALQEIRNEVFVFDAPDKKAFDINFKPKTKLSKSIQKKIQEEFDYLYHAIDFENNGMQWFDDWYVDGCLYLHKIVDSKNPRAGVKRVTQIDPLKIRKVRIVPEPNADGTFDLARVREVFIYRAWDHRTHPLNQTIQFQYGTQVQGIQIHPDSITYVNSGRFDRNLGKYVGYLRKAIVPFNNLKMMEEAMVIFRVVRAPQRRAFYVDVSGLQKNKAEQYMKELIAKFQTKMLYDTSSGSLSDRRNIISMLEDYWLPRRDGGKGTEIQNLEGQSAQDIMDEIEYLRDNLWRALNVPRGRFTQEGSTFDFGKNTLVQRDEYRFTKFLSLLRSKFLMFMEDVLRTHLIQKKIIQESEWDDVERSFQWTFAEDNNFVEYKELEVLNNRLAVLNAIDQYVGKYFSAKKVKRLVLRQDDNEIDEEQKQMDKEREENPPEDPDAQPPETQQAGQPDQQEVQDGYFEK